MEQTETRKVVRRGFKYRLKPTEQQEKMLQQHGGNSRHLWNQLLSLNQDTYDVTGKFVFYYDMVKVIKVFRSEDFPFYQQSYSQSLQQTAKQLDKALRDSFKGTCRFPRFKKKSKCNDSFLIPQGFKLSKGEVYLPKIGWVRWVKHRSLKGKPKSVTVKQENNHWYASVQCEFSVEIKEPDIDSLKDILGIDLGLKEFAVMSDGRVAGNPHCFRELEEKLGREQRKLSRKLRGSRNFLRQKKRVNKVHAKARRKRDDFLHKLTDLIAKNPEVQGVAVEDLNVKGMVKNRHLSKAISDVSWSKFKQFLSYKLDERSKPLIKVDRFFPSSKTCNKCGHVQNMPLQKRTYRCETCGSVLDRDLNASLNIRDEGYRLFTLGQRGFDDCGGLLRCKKDPSETVKRKCA